MRGLRVCVAHIIAILLSVSYCLAYNEDSTTLRPKVLIQTNTEHARGLAIRCTKVRSAGRCNRRCRRNDAARFTPSCQIGEEEKVRNRRKCHFSCQDDSKCTGYEFYKVKGARLCTKYSCATKRGAAWSSVQNLRTFAMYEFSECRVPTAFPTAVPTHFPTKFPSASPVSPTNYPTQVPTKEPTNAPSEPEDPPCLPPEADSSFRQASDAQKLEFRAFANKAVRKPNILFILVDDFGVGDVNVQQFGPVDRLNDINTPNLQAMADNGVTFTQAYSPGTVCLPSRYSLLVGKHTGHIPVRGNSGLKVDIPLDSDEKTLPQVLKGAGYTTGLVGKWGLGDDSDRSHPVQMGFDYYYGQISHVSSHVCFPSRLYENYAGDESLDANVVISENRFASEETCTIDSLDAESPCKFNHDLFTSKALEFIQSNAKKPNPFFLMLSWISPHLCTWTDFSDGAQLKVAPYVSQSCIDSFNEPEVDLIERSPPLEECRHKSLLENYIDRDLGRLMNLLKTLKVYDDTLVVFAGDNGPEEVSLTRRFYAGRYKGYRQVHTVHPFNSAKDLRGIKRDLYEGGIRTPMIVQWPRYGARGVVSDVPFVLYDLLPSFAEAAGLNVDSLPEGLTGVSFLPTLIGSPNMQQKHRYLYWEYCDQQSRNWSRLRFYPEEYCSWAIRFGSWKLLYNANTGRRELYDLSVDENEAHNLYLSGPPSSQDSERTIALRQRLSFLTCERERNAYIPLTTLNFVP